MASAVNRRIVSFLFCLPFANRAYVSGHLYIEFTRNHLIFLVAYLVCQVDALIILSLREHAYALHVMPCIASCCLHIAPWLIVVPLLVFLLWVERGGEYVMRNLLSTLSRIKLSTTLRTLQARCPYPWNHFYLCLLVIRSIAMSRYLPVVISCLLYFHVKPLTHLS